MRNALLIILLLVSALTGSAQNYISFPDSNAIWLVRHGRGDTMPAFYYYGLTNEDTIINSTVYHKLLRSTDTVFSSNEYYAALRQDVLAKKVYSYAYNASSEHLLYDFSVNIGDTVNNITGSSTSAIVYSIDSILIAGTYHKQIHFMLYSASSVWPFGSWVEGVGNIALGGLLGAPTLQPTCDCADNLVCFKGNDAWQYHNIGYSFIDCSAPPLRIEKHEIPKVETCILYPNPVSGISYLHLNVGTRLIKLDIYNVNGELVMSNTLAEGIKDVILDRKDYVPGCYYYRLYDVQGNAVAGKFVVE
jgi:hypothetical protein